LDNGNSVKDMVEVNNYGMMVVNMKDIGKIMLHVVKED